MSGISYNIWQEMSDSAISEIIGSFVKKNRLDQNLTQAQIAKNAGISRSTLSLLENGENVSVTTLLQVLRSLNLLQVLENFELHQQVSPLAEAKLEAIKRKRARNNLGNQVNDVNFEPW